MTEYIKEPNGSALSILENELMRAVFAELETDAIERGLRAAHSDNETRLYASMEVETIRSVQGKLSAMAAGEVKPSRPDPAA